jgi:hypothetical protein
LLILFIREQVLAIVSLILLGAATALTAQFPSLGGLLFVTLLSSIGFHYYETVNQSLQLQWLDKKKAPQVLGWLLSVGSGATLLAYLLIVLTWRAYDLSYDLVYWVAGGVTVAIALVCFFAFPAIRKPQSPDQEDGPAAALLALLRAAVHVGGAAADLRRLRGLHDGGALRVRGARDHGAVHGHASGQHDRGAVAGASWCRAWRASGADRGICRAGAIFLLYAGLYVFDWGQVSWPRRFTC